MEWRQKAQEFINETNKIPREWAGVRSNTDDVIIVEAGRRTLDGLKERAIHVRTYRSDGTITDHFNA